MLGAAKADQNFNDEETNFLPFMRTCIHNAIKDELRKVVRRKDEISSSEITEAVAEEAINIEEHMIQKERVKEAWKVVDKIFLLLDRKERYILLFNVISNEPESVRHMAEGLDYSKSKIHRIKQKIEEMIDGYRN